MHSVIFLIKLLCMYVCMCSALTEPVVMWTTIVLQVKMAVMQQSTIITSEYLNIYYIKRAIL